MQGEIGGVQVSILTELGAIEYALRHRFWKVLRPRAFEPSPERGAERLEGARTAGRWTGLRERFGICVRRKSAIQRIQCCEGVAGLRVARRWNKRDVHHLAGRGDNPAPRRPASRRLGDDRCVEPELAVDTIQYCRSAGPGGIRQRRLIFGKGAAVEAVGPSDKPSAPSL